MDIHAKLTLGISLGPDCWFVGIVYRERTTQETHSLSSSVLYRLELPVVAMVTKLSVCLFCCPSAKD